VAIDLRKDLRQNLIFAGYFSMLENLPTRTQAELTKLVEPNI